MAGMTGSKTMRDSSGVSSMVDNAIVPELDAWARSPQRGGSVDGSRHGEYIKNVSNAIREGKISREGAANLATRIKGLAPFILPALKSSSPYDEYFQPGKAEVPAQPEQPFQTNQEQEFGLPGLTGNVAQYAQEGQAAVPAKFDYEGGLATALGRGDVNMVNALAASRGGKDSPFSKINPKDYTRESIRQFASSGDYSSLIPTVDKVENDAKERAKSNDIFKNEGALRDDFTKLAGPFIQVRDSYGRIKESAKDPSAAGDLALIFNYMKMLDPGSTVREGEFATAQNSAGIPDRVKAMYNNTISGERLSDKTRKDFLSRSDMLYSRQLSTHKKLEKQFKGLAGKYGLSGERSVPDYTSDEPTAPKAPANTPGGSMPPGWTVEQR